MSKVFHSKQLEINVPLLTVFHIASIDSGSHDEGIHIPRSNKEEDCVIAKSLPMTIPAFNNVMLNNGRDLRSIPKKKVGVSFSFQEC